jgi:hypothetical protein
MLSIVFIFACMKKIQLLYYVNKEAKDVLHQQGHMYISQQ